MQLAALGIDAPVAPFGHSDGGSIALWCAARFPPRVSTLVVMAPHILVEPVSVASIAEARAAEIGATACPVLAIQGLDDEDGTRAPVRGIARRVPGSRLLELPARGHPPHRDQPEAVIAALGSILKLL